MAEPVTLALGYTPEQVATAAVAAMGPLFQRERGQRENAICEEFKTDLAVTFLPTMPSVVTDEVFRMAWAAAWSSQYPDLYATAQDHYQEFARLVGLVEQAVTRG